MLESKVKRLSQQVKDTPLKPLTPVETAALFDRTLQELDRFSSFKVRDVDVSLKMAVAKIENEVVFVFPEPGSVDPASLHELKFTLRGSASDVDSNPPSIGNETPTGLVAPGNIKILAKYSDDETGIDQSTATMMLDGQTVEADSSVFGIEYTEKLGPGQYTVHVEVCDKAGNKASKEWTFIVAEDDSPVMKLSKEELDFGETKTAESFNISNAGGGSLTWQVSEVTAEWVVVSPTKGSLEPKESDTIAVNISRKDLDQGEYTSSVSIDSDGDKGKIELSMIVPPSDPISLTPTPLDLGVEDTKKVFVITNLTSSDMGWRITSRQPNWIINVDPKGGTISPGATANVSVQVYRQRLNAGQYQHEISIRYDDENGNILTVPFMITMGVSN